MAGKFQESQNILLYTEFSKEYFTKLQFKTSHDFNARNICTYMQKLPFQMYANIVLCTQILSCVRKYFPVYANIVLCTLWEQFKETQCSLCKGRRKALRYLLFFFLQICPIRLSPKFQFLLPKFYSVFQMLNSFFKIVDSFLRMLNSFIEIF